MKTILVPTDYSEVAYNAERYAIELAKTFDSKFILFHAYHRPILLSSLALLFADQELEKFNFERLKAEEYIIKHECCDKVGTESLAYKGRAVDGILQVIKERPVDYIIMGITGSGLLSEVLIGSTTLAVIKKTKIPVFVIPKEAKYKTIKKIVFIHNYEEVTPQNVTDEIKMFCDQFGAELIIYGKPKLQDIENFKKVRSRVEVEFSNIPTSVVNNVIGLSQEEDITQEINSFVDLNKADMIAMMPNTSKSYQSIFNRDNVVKMAFHTRIPLLILHDNSK